MLGAMEPAQGVTVLRVPRDAAVLVEPEAVRLDGPVPHARGGAIYLPWASIARVELLDPWPWVRLHLRRGSGGEILLVPSEEPATLEAAAERLAVEAPTHRVSVSRGWLDIAVVPWEHADTWPTDRGSAPAMGGPFRTAEDPSAEALLAERPAPSSLDKLLAWVVGGVRQGPDLALAAAVTTTHVYARFGGREPGRVREVRVPLGALRARILEFHDAHYVFGRSTRLWLTRRETCPVAKILEERLATQAAQATSRPRA